MVAPLTCSLATARIRRTGCPHENKVISTRRSRRHHHDRRAGRAGRRTVLKIDSEISLEGREPPGAAHDRLSCRGDLAGDPADGARTSCLARSGRTTAVRCKRWARQGQRLQRCAALLCAARSFVVVRTFGGGWDRMQLGDMLSVSCRHAGSVTGLRVDREAALDALESSHTCTVSESACHVVPPRVRWVYIREQPRAGRSRVNFRPR